MKTIEGLRTAAGCVVRVRGERGWHYLRERQDLASMSALGFEWGDKGTGSLQLALAILAEMTGDDALALRLHRTYCAEVVVAFPAMGWVVDESAVGLWLLRKHRELRDQ